MSNNIVGLDIGGANIKGATLSGHTVHQPFALWKEPDRLCEQLVEVLKVFLDVGRLGITMTGELCDCFETKREGVSRILDAVSKAAGDIPTQVWSTQGRFVSPGFAVQNPLTVAASNWHALATFAGRLAPSDAAMLIDIGSTTTDIIPLLGGEPIAVGRTDPERLRAYELVYVGARRTPVCAFLEGHCCNELFATTLDVFLLLNQLPEDESDTNTADGRPATRYYALSRMARMLGGDRETTDEIEVMDLTEKVYERIIDLIGEAITRVGYSLPTEPQKVILAGSGAFLVDSLLDWGILQNAEVISLSEMFDRGISCAACAYAVANLAGERWHDGVE